MNEITVMILNRVERILLDRGWLPLGSSVWTVIIGNEDYLFDTRSGVLTSTEGYVNGDLSMPRLVQRHMDIATVMSLGFSDYWNDPEDKLERDRLRLESDFSM